jgi:Chaperone of endosialidase
MSGIIAAAGITAAAGLAAGGMQMLNKPGGGGTQTQMTQQQLPMGIQQRESDNYDLAMQTANQLMGPYGGQRVADMTPEQRNLIAQLYGNVGSTNAAFGQAGAATNALMGFNPSMVTPQMLANTNLQPYMNPYSSMVINPAMQQMEASRKQSLMQLGDQATQNKAFGGSRQGIAEGVQNAASELQRGQFMGQMLGQDFAQAQAAATGDINRDFSGQQFNSQQGLAGAQFRGNMAQQLAGLSQAQQQNYLAGINAAMGGQGLLQQQSQQELDAARQYYMEQRQQPLDVLGIRQNALAQSPYGQTTYSSGPGPSSNPMLTGLGTAATTAGLLGQFGLFNRSPSIPTPASQGIEVGSIGGMPQSYYLSDRRLKTDIRKIGRDRATDIDLYAYRYKGDPKHYPLVVGPMAQDVQKKYPDAVFKAGPYLGIKTNFLSGMAA